MTFERIARAKSWSFVIPYVVLLVLTAIGITTTHKLSKGTGYTVATIAFLISLLLGAAIAGMFGGRAG